MPFLPLQDSEAVGDVYQDEVNQAAILVYKDKADNAMLMVINNYFKLFFLILFVFSGPNHWDYHQMCIVINF